MTARIFAHRGHHLDGCPENTLDAFHRAEALGADGFETDLRHTADRRLVLYHDDTVSGVPVEVMTLDELRRSTGIQVPTLEDVLRRQWRCAINLEIKTREAWALAAPFIPDLPPRTLVTSFIHRIAFDAAEMGLRSGLLTASVPEEPCPRGGRGPATWVVDARVLDEYAATAFRSTGWTLATYATAGEARHRQAIELGASLVITDEVDLAMRIRNEYPS